MRSASKIREFLSQYQQKLKLDFSSRPVGLERRIKLPCQASDTCDAATLNHLLQINGYKAAQDFITLQSQAMAHNPATTGPTSRINTG